MDVDVPAEVVQQDPRREAVGLVQGPPPPLASVQGPPRLEAVQGPSRPAVDDGTAGSDGTAGADGTEDIRAPDNSFDTIPGTQKASTYRSIAKRTLTVQIIDGGTSCSMPTTEAVKIGKVSYTSF